MPNRRLQPPPAPKLPRTQLSNTEHSACKELSTFETPPPAIVPVLSPPFLHCHPSASARAGALSTAAARASSADATGSLLDPSRLWNVAVIAHIDHGKTTLMDRLLRQRSADIPHEQAVDSISLEHEPGITIASKVTSISWRDNELNMVDTASHADFGGEVILLNPSELLINMMHFLNLASC